MMDILLIRKFFESKAEEACPAESGVKNLILFYRFD